LLTGKYTRENPSPEGARYADVSNNARFAARKTEEVYDVVEELAPIAQAKGVTMAQCALAWCMQQPGVTSPIIGPRTMEQLEDNLGALPVTITAEDRAAVDRLVPPGRMASPFYEADFGSSKYRW
jgi:aryl-alcohol dehydrogenase-like predicted oxidoreductase